MLAQNVAAFIAERRRWMGACDTLSLAVNARIRMLIVSLQLAEFGFDCLRANPTAEPLQRGACIVGTAFGEQPVRCFGDLCKMSLNINAVSNFRGCVANSQIPRELWL